MALQQAAHLLIETLAALFGVALLLRAYVNWLGLPGRNPLVQFILALTNWLVGPLRRLTPAVGRIDSASLIATALVALVALLLNFALLAPPAAWPWSSVPLLVLAKLARWALYLVMWVTILQALLSWINPYAPAAPALSVLARPFMAPFQKIIPPIGGVDLSPLLVVLVVNLLLVLLP
jgi:YggT family protein